MIKLTYCLHLKPSLTRADFQDYWRNKHAPLVAAVATEAGQKHARILFEDEAKFIDFARSRSFITKANEVI